MGRFLSQNLPIIARSEYVDFLEFQHIPARIDTGAATTAIWASNFHVDSRHVLSFVFFTPASPYFTGKVHTTSDFDITHVRSSMGHSQIRYKVKIPLRLNQKTIECFVSLADRGRNHYPVLIGRNVISGNFLVDVSKSRAPLKTSRPRVQPKSEKSPLPTLKTAFQQNPHHFHQTHFDKDQS